MRNIFVAWCMVPLLLAVAGFVVSCEARAGEAGVPKKLTPDTFEAIKARVTLTPAELAWQQARWRNGFFEGVLDAQAEDKPIFFWFYGGGPTGNC